jgi:glycosyltransferase involved in cell wall biosynthesis
MNHQVVHHQRLPGHGQISIERLFATIRLHLPPDIEPLSICSPQPSLGLLPRLLNLWAAWRQPGEVHHILGDVHYLGFALAPRRTILTIHDCEPLNRLRGWKRAVLRYFWYTGPIRRAAIVTTISETAKNELISCVGALANKVIVIPNCVGDEFSAEPKDFARDTPVVLQVGTGWNKNVVRVAEALRGTSCVLEIVGTLSTEQRLAIDSSGVLYRELGRLSDTELVSAYKRCDIVIFASLYEGFGLPILEAQATGRPVITSNRSAMPEAAGSGALLVDPESVEAISGAVSRLIHEPALRSDLIAAGFANVAKYSPAAIAAKYAAAYRKLL